MTAEVNTDVPFYMYIFLCVSVFIFGGLFFPLPLRIRDLGILTKREKEREMREMLSEFTAEQTLLVVY